jgi:hypothetical protein
MMDVVSTARLKPCPDTKPRCNQASLKSFIYLRLNSDLKRVFFTLPFWLSVSSSSLFSSHDTGLVVAE